MREKRKAEMDEVDVLRNGDWHAKWAAAGLPNAAGVLVEFERVGSVLGLEPEAIRLTVLNSGAAYVRGVEAMDSRVLYSFLAGVQAARHNTRFGVVRKRAPAPRKPPTSGTVPPAGAP